MSTALDQDTFRHAMTRFAAGVTIVTTTVDDHACAWGITASAFASLSLAPPLVLVCLDAHATCHASFAVADRFAVNILRPEDESLARRFASKGVDKFGSGAFAPSAPGLPDTLVVVECATEQRVPGGDHTILIGRVEHCQVGDGAPIVYYNRAFHRLAPGTWRA